MWGSGTPWRVSHKAERESVVLDDPTDIVELMRWLGDTSERTFMPRAASPASFAIAIPASHWLGGDRPDRVVHFFNWRFTAEDDDLRHIENTGDAVRDEETGKKIRNSAGEVVDDEYWERLAHAKITLYNKADAHFEGAREFVQARKNEKFRFYFKSFQGSIVIPQGPNYDGGATKEDAENHLPGGFMMPDLKFEQQDDNGAFLPLTAPTFETWPGDPDVLETRQVITTQHRRQAFGTFIRQGMPEEIARIQVKEAFKDAYTFDPTDADYGGEEKTELTESDLYTTTFPYGPDDPFPSKDAYHSKNISGYSIFYRLPLPTRRRGPSPPSSPQPKEGKREKTEAPYFLQTKCSFCNRRKAVAVCDGCGEAKYCGEKCQEIAWHFDDHHKTCIQK